MKCKYPFRKGLAELGCGKCLPCRINRQRQITIRGLLEAGQHAHSTFATLTYDEEHLPTDGSVSVRVAQLFLKLLRYHHGPFRYIICGEYGSRIWRPHYHAILFGVRDGHCLQDAWKNGRIHISGVGPESIAYVAGYCLKGATDVSGMTWHGKSLTPEFVRWSRRPPIGAWAADRIGAFYTGVGKPIVEQNGDVSAVVRQGKKFWPLGRYLRDRARAVAGVSKEVLSKSRQLTAITMFKDLDACALNEYIAQADFQSEASGLRAEAKYKRMSLEKKL